ncbi:uncharacterized protein LOC105421839 [Amborella trichopoda]|uniref:uncharacterized protein LOC105421839 n=1 Tax=Amborella trichopoda TaxID=13333 RepID=UPI0005D44830|nr:uncharacterized protein LOC105421839 [Amborella trichopoda]|eukprot:XP_011629104.1 uncharacterized protein LOC105421839 [Amborella trichopoda]
MEFYQGLDYYSSEGIVEEIFESLELAFIIKAFGFDEDAKDFPGIELFVARFASHLYFELSCLPLTSTSSFHEPLLFLPVARRCRSPELHRRFVNALQQLGGSQVATPKEIRELMNFDGLTNDEVKCHLQKYRLPTRRPNVSVSSANSNQQNPPLVLLSNLWLPHDKLYDQTSSTPSGSSS